MRDPAPLRIAAALATLAFAVPARAQLGIDLRGGEKKPPGQPVKPDATRKPVPLLPETKPPQKPVTMPELDVGSAGAEHGEAARRIAEANQVFARGDDQTAALAYDAILRDPALAEVHDQARYQLARSLARLGLYHSSLAWLDQILAKGAQGSPYFKDALEWLFHVGKQTGNEALITAQVLRYAGGTFPASEQDRYDFLLARYSYERGLALDEAGRSAEARRAYDDASRLAGQVRPEAGSRPSGNGQLGDPYARARFVDGLVKYAQGQSQAAVESFKDVVRLTNPRRGRAPDSRIRELAFLQLARIHYEHKQNRYAIFYYDKMPWGGGSWLEGLWESSYAHYRIGDYEKALGNLLTLQSPYFRDEWFPESWILKAIIYYENCRYPEARSILDEFHANYEGVYRELERLTSGPAQPRAFFDALDDAGKSRGANTVLMRRIMKVALTDRNVKQLDGSIVEVDRERAALASGRTGLREAFRSSSLARDLTSGLDRERQQLADEAGARARAKLEYERDALRELLQQALRIKIEVARNERAALETALNRGGPVDVVKDYRYSVAVSDEQQYWPYDGEFWRDELGTYTYTLTKGCRDTGVRAR